MDELPLSLGQQRLRASDKVSGLRKASRALSEHCMRNLKPEHQGIKEHGSLLARTICANPKLG